MSAVAAVDRLGEGGARRGRRVFIAGAASDVLVVILLGVVDMLAAVVMSATKRPRTRVLRARRGRARCSWPDSRLARCSGRPVGVCVGWGTEEVADIVCPSFKQLSFF